MVISIRRVHMPGSARSPAGVSWKRIPHADGPSRQIPDTSILQVLGTRINEPGVEGALWAALRSAYGKQLTPAQIAAFVDNIQSGNVDQLRLFMARLERGGKLRKAVDEHLVPVLFPPVQPEPVVDSRTAMEKVKMLLGENRETIVQAAMEGEDPFALAFLASVDPTPVALRAIEKLGDIAHDPKKSKWAITMFELLLDEENGLPPDERRDAAMRQYGRWAKRTFDSSGSPETALMLALKPHIPRRLWRDCVDVLAGTAHWDDAQKRHALWQVQDANTHSLRLPYLGEKLAQLALDGSSLPESDVHLIGAPAPGPASTSTAGSLATAATVLAHMPPPGRPNDVPNAPPPGVIVAAAPKPPPPPPVAMVSDEDVHKQAKAAEQAVKEQTALIIQAIQKTQELTEFLAITGNSAESAFVKYLRLLDPSFAGRPAQKRVDILHDIGRTLHVEETRNNLFIAVVMHTLETATRSRHIEAAAHFVIQNASDLARDDHYTLLLDNALVAAGKRLAWYQGGAKNTVRHALEMLTGERGK